MTLTGAAADRRATAYPDEIARAAHMLAGALGASVSAPTPSPPVAALMNAAARDLLAARGRALVLVGRDHPAALHAFAAWANNQLKAPADWIAPVDPDPAPHAAGLAALAEEMHAGAVRTLLMLDCNPVYHAPLALGFADGLKRVPLSIAAASFPSETTAAATRVAPLAHGLEVWGDLRGPDGTTSLVQPLIRPLYDGCSALRILDLLDPRAATASDHARVQAIWRPQAGPDFGRWWTETLVAGVVAASAAPPVAVPAPRLVLPESPKSGPPPVIVSVLPSPALWDGRYASNAWAQECPEPLTKEVWGSSLRVARSDAERLGLDDGMIVRLGGIEAPARIVPGQADGVMTLFAGYGRRDSGPIADGIGANAFALRGAPADSLVPQPTGRHATVQSTQHFFRLEGDLAKLFPVLAPGAHMPAPAPQASVLPAASPSGPAEHAWAMVIDTSVCIGCNACVVACQAENNVPVIGVEEIAMGRDMHWLRVDRYDRGDGDDPRPGFQPVPCMHCEKAPCEPVCPVEASVHDAEGLNVQVYNRCIGTRTCQANCPYKVRRFNFLAYPDPEMWKPYDAASLTAQHNPDVTVRARGVMEKCTYCLQRISAAKHRAAATGAPIRDGDVVTACEAACPTRAIAFGDLADPVSRVNTEKRDPRHYALLEELGTRPRTTYLAKVRATEDEA
jgi:molybdopterin-containing oxidoreductase family iron-sulfur binding subunit